VAAPSASVELWGTPKLGADDEERFVEEVMIFQIFNQGGERVIEFADEGVLIVDALVVNVPASAVDEI
jgi:hypothetical protein